MIKEENKIYKFEYRMVILQLFSFVLLGIFLLGIFLIHKLGVIDASMLGEYIKNLFIEPSFEFLILFILMWIWMFLHEFIHGITYVFGGADYKNIKYGIVLEKGILYCKCGQYVNKNAILLSIISPFIWIGVITLIIGFIINSPLLIILSLINIAGASADVLLFFSFFIFRDKDLEFKEIKDSSTFLIKTKEDLTNKKFISVKLVEVLDEDCMEKEDKIFTITKASKFFITIFILMFILYLLSLLFINL